ncbi:MAG: UDP-N-acetylmuramate dehydrogenase [Pseudomonadota bacterium]
MRDLVSALPAVRGRIEAERRLAPLTWLRVGGPADVLFTPADADDLTGFLAALDPETPLTPLGLCSNLIVRDGGLPGVAVRLGRAFNRIEVLEGYRMRAGAAALDAQVAKRAAEAGIAGLEFLRTIPGCIGGAVAMNAGCYGTYMADVVEEITLATSQGLLTLTGAEAGFGYRHSTLPERAVVLSATLCGAPGNPDVIAARMADLMAKRADSQPLDQRSCGSTFRNPAGFSSTGLDGDPMALKAWYLIDQAGCRGLSHGGAQMSEKHANFLINADNASASDLETLGEIVRARVKSHTGVDLVWEIQRIGTNLTLNNSR